MLNGRQLQGTAGCTIRVVLLVSENHIFEKYDLWMVVIITLSVMGIEKYGNRTTVGAR